MNDDPILYEVRSVKLSRVVHAEVNAVLNARENVAGHTCHVTHPCCSRCAIFLIQAGVKRLVTPTPDDMFKSKWIEEWVLADKFFEEAGVERVYV